MRSLRQSWHVLICIVDAQSSANRVATFVALAVRRNTGRLEVAFVLCATSDALKGRAIKLSGYLAS